MTKIAWDESAEQAVLGAMLVSPNTIPVVGDILTAEDFYRKRDQEIFVTILSLWVEDETSADAVTVARRHPEHRDYIFALSESCITSANVDHYAELVRADSVSRNLRRVGLEIVEISDKMVPDGPVKMLNEAESRLSSVQMHNTSYRHHSAEVAYRIIDAIERGEKPKMVSTGFSSIDKYAKGFYGSNFVILGARPGVGKTCLGLAVAQRIALEGHVLFFSLEMRAEELGERLLASIAGVSLTRIREHSTTEQETESLKRAQAVLDDSHLSIVDDPSLTMFSLASRVRSETRRQEVKLIVVDYLQLMTLGAKSEGRREEVSEMSRRLKALAMETNVPILALSQLNRVSTFDNNKIDISQLRESGSLEQDADMVWLLDWPKNNDDTWNVRVVELTIAKNRHGPMGKVDLYWQPAYQRYEE